MSTHHFIISKAFGCNVVNPVIHSLRFWSGVVLLPFETPFDDFHVMVVVWLTNLELKVLEEAISLYHLISVLLALWL